MLFGDGGGLERQFAQSGEQQVVALFEFLLVVLVDVLPATTDVVIEQVGLDLEFQHIVGEFACGVFHGGKLLGDVVLVVAKEVGEVLFDAVLDEGFHALDGAGHVHSSGLVPDVERDIGRLSEPEGPAPDLRGAGALVEVGVAVAGDCRHERETQSGSIFGFVGVFHIIGG